MLFGASLNVDKHMWSACSCLHGRPSYVVLLVMSCFACCLLSTLKAQGRQKRQPFQTIRWTYTEERSTRKIGCFPTKLVSHPFPRNKGYSSFVTSEKWSTQGPTVLWRQPATSCCFVGGMFALSQCSSESQAQRVSNRLPRSGPATKGDVASRKRVTRKTWYNKVRAIACPKHLCFILVTNHSPFTGLTSLLSAGELHHVWPALTVTPSADASHRAIKKTKNIPCHDAIDAHSCSKYFHNL